MNVRAGVVQNFSQSIPGQEEEQQWRLAERIACSRSFSRSQFLSRFLLYVCDRKLQNRIQEISEQQIGVSVFGRPAGYDCGEDNIVRNYARILRRRLKEYFETEGQNEVWHVSIPRGGYTPFFSLQSERASAPQLEVVEESPAGSHAATIAEAAMVETIADETTIEDTEEEGAPEESNSAASPVLEMGVAFFQQRAVWVGVLTALLLLVLGGSTYATYHHLQTRSPAHLLWAALFPEDQRTLLVPADSGIGILQNLTQKPVHIDQYANRNYLPETDAEDRGLNDLRTQRYTSGADLNTILMLSHLPEAQPEKSLVRFARDLTMDDFKRSNIVLLGSSHSNPWVEIFEKELNFRFEYGAHADDSRVRNAHPLKGEAEVYENEWNKASHRTYAVVALRPNLSGNGWVLIIEGLNMAGTEAAADILFQGAFIRDFLKQASTPNHGLHPFELLIETTSLGSQPERSRVLAKRLE